MSKAETYIRDYTKRCSNTIVQAGDKGNWESGGFEVVYQPWLTPENALAAVEIAREEMIDKVIGWIEEINNHHHIMRYSDSCEPSLGELTEWFKNYIKKGGKE